MKIKLFLIAALVAAFAFTSCSEDNPVKDGDNNPLKVIEPVQNNEIDVLQKNYLDTIFSEKNQLIPQDWQIDSNIYVINSLEELNEINADKVLINIDFSKYTLIGGRVTINSLTPDIKISLEGEANNPHIDYYLTVELDYTKGGFYAMGNIYFWRLYPKLKNTSEVITIVKEIYAED
jgi:hypothetical protein